MRTELTETVTFTTVRYRCDHCGQRLLEGQRPMLCEVCERGCCPHCLGPLVLAQDLHFSVCPACAAQVIWRAQMQHVHLEYRALVARLLEAWKLASHATTH